ncbi:MAG: JAB domain-containing protein [Candidatus Sphingomonas colombiensis]|nr:JAB domain-containing protein [Sphingomonas sp.]WEK43499.1 MAG: JAB domain-containing protein [Sphingomonas sp.]
MARLFMPIARAQTEIAIFAYLNSAGQLLALRHVPSGNVAEVEVPIRAIAGDALAFGADQVMMAHNHPSGDAEPTRDDLATTRRIATALDALGIRLVDHLVLAGGSITSLRARGLL